MSLKPIVQALGGDLYDRGLRANIPAPDHSAADRSVSLLLREGRVIVHTFGDGDWKDVLDYLRGEGLVDAHNAPTTLSQARRAQSGAPVTGLERRQAALRAGRPAGRSQARCRRATARFAALAVPCPAPTCCAMAVRRPFRPMPKADTIVRPCSAICDRDGGFTAVEVTYLAPNGRLAIDLRLSRKTVGPSPALLRGAHR